MPAPAERHAEARSALLACYRIVLAAAARADAEGAERPAAAEQDHPTEAA